MFALGNSGGGSLEAAVATLGRFASQPQRGDEDEVYCLQCDVVV